MNDERYVEPSRKGQVVLLAMLALAALIVVLLEPTITRLTPSPGVSQQEFHIGVRVLTLVALGTFAIAFLASLFWVTYFGRIGYRALKLRTFPPPGTLVVRRTIIRMGTPATVAGYFALAFSGLMSLFAILAAYVTCLLAGAL